MDYYTWAVYVNGQLAVSYLLTREGAEKLCKEIMETDRELEAVCYDTSEGGK